MKTLITVLFTISACIYLSGQTSFVQRSIDPDHTAVSGIAAVDFDRDGDVDVIANHRVIDKVIIWENDGNMQPGWNMKLLSEQVIGPMYIFAGDVNADSLPDLVISSAATNSLYCFINTDGLNHWDVYIMDDTFEGAHGVCIEDINNDGLPDIIATAAGDNMVAWWENNGLAPDTWTKTVISDQMNGSQTVTASDMNNDGFMDIVAASSDLNKVVVYFNNGDTIPSFYEQIACQTLMLPHWVSVADIDDDGNKDILVAACSSGKIAWLKNDGDSIINWTQHTIGSNFGCSLTVEAADFDMDGDLDVAATAYGSNNVAWWEQDTSNNQITWELHMLSGNYKGAWPLVIADVEGDTDKDILTGGDLLNGLGNESPLSVWENQMLMTGINKGSMDEDESMKVFPQPATDHIIISYCLADKATVSIALYNMQGMKLGEPITEYQTAGNHRLEIQFSDMSAGLKPGMYICSLVANDIRINKKVLITNN